MKKIDQEIARIDKVLVAIGCSDVYHVVTWAGHDDYVMVLCTLNPIMIECNLRQDGTWLYEVDLADSNRLTYLSLVDAVAVAEAERLGMDSVVRKDVKLNDRGSGMTERVVRKDTKLNDRSSGKTEACSTKLRKEQSTDISKM